MVSNRIDWISHINSILLLTMTFECELLALWHSVIRDCKYLQFLVEELDTNTSFNRTDSKFYSIVLYEQQIPLSLGEHSMHRV